MTILHMQTDQVAALTRQLDHLAENVYERIAAVEHTLRASAWQGGSQDMLLQEIAIQRRQLQTAADALQQLAAAGRRELDQWQDAAARLESGRPASGWRPGWMAGAGLIGLGSLAGGAFIGSTSRLAANGVPSTAGTRQSSNFYQIGVKRYSYQQLLEESRALQQEIARLQQQLAALPSLESLNGDLAANETLQASLRGRIADLDAQMDALHAQWRLDDDGANKWWNQILPSREGGWDSEDGLPWRTRADDFEDSRAAAMAEIYELGRQRSNLNEELALLQGRHDDLTATRQRVEGMQQDLQYHQENKVFVDQRAAELAPPQAPRPSPGSAPPGAHNVPLVNQRAVRHRGHNGDYACTPTSLSMITEYYHSQNPANTRVSPVDLIQMQEPDPGGYSMTRGSSISNFTDDLRELGYNSRTTSNNTIASLQAQLAEGPVVALGQMHGGAHAFVVTGVENGVVSIADPWGGVNRTYTTQQFNSLWQGVGNTYLVAVRPG